jgi:hypothetical protein
MFPLVSQGPSRWGNRIGAQPGAPVTLKAIDASGIHGF